VGGIGVLAPDEEGVGAVAETDTLTLELPASALIEIFEDQFSILHHVMREVCRQVIGLFRRPGVDPPFPPPQTSPVVPGRELDLVERIFLVRRYAPFKHASVNALAELSRGLTEARFEPGDALWHEGEPASWVSLLVTGTVTCVLPGGRRFRAGPGAPLGALESVAEWPRWYEPVTETPVVALHGNIQGLLDVFEDNFAMAMDYLAVMARLLALAHERTVASEESRPRLYAGTEMSTVDAESPA
jgi:CRP-like cAMP-binding protein